MCLRRWQNYRIKKNAAKCVMVLVRLQKMGLQQQRWSAKGFLRAEQQRYHQLHILWRTMAVLNRMLIKSHDLFFLNEKINHLVEIFFSLHQLRFRLKDKSLLEICIYEWLALEKKCIVSLLQLAKGVRRNAVNVPVDELLEKIYAFETIYQRAIHIVAPRPIVFSFYIQDYYAFAEELRHINEYYN